MSSGQWGPSHPANQETRRTSNSGSRFIHPARSVFPSSLSAMCCTNKVFRMDPMTGLPSSQSDYDIDFEDFGTDIAAIERQAAANITGLRLDTSSSTLPIRTPSARFIVTSNVYQPSSYVEEHINSTKFEVSTASTTKLSTVYIDRWAVPRRTWSYQFWHRRRQQ